MKLNNGTGKNSISTGRNCFGTDRQHYQYQDGLRTLRFFFIIVEVLRDYNRLRIGFGKGFNLTAF